MTVTKTMGDHEAVYEYRYGDKLKQVTSTLPDEASLSQYITDGLGKRREKVVDSNYTWYRWDAGWNLVGVYYGDSSWTVGTQYMFFVDNPGGTPGSMLAASYGSADPATGWYLYGSHDNLGSVRRIRLDNQYAAATYEYSPYGDLITQDGSVPTLGFTGHQYDPEIAFYYAPYRYYNPITARWLTRDPLGMKDGPNLYAYVGGNPVTSTDELGLRKGDWLDRLLSYWYEDDESTWFANLVCQVSAGVLIATYGGKIASGVNKVTGIDLQKLWDTLVKVSKKQLRENVGRKETTAILGGTAAAVSVTSITCFALEMFGEWIGDFIGEHLPEF